jgi:hypothetical protein
MSDFVINEDTGDVEVTAGAIALTSGQDAIRQRLANQLRMVRGEWFLDANAGTDYYNEIFGKKPFIQIDNELTRAILSVDGVVEIVDTIDYNFDSTRRVLAVEFEVITTAGTIEFQTELTGVSP